MVHPVKKLVVVPLDESCSVFLDLNKEELVVMFAAGGVE